MQELTVEQYEAMVSKRNVKVTEAKEVKAEDGTTRTPVRIERRGFRPVEAVVVVREAPEENPAEVPCPRGWDRAETSVEE